MIEKQKIGSSGAVIAVLIISALVFVLPLLTAFLLSFQSYSPLSGLFSSYWVGFENFTRIFDSFVFSSLLFNSVRLSVVGNILPIILGVLIAKLICANCENIRPLWMAGLLLPAFVPSSVYAMPVIKFFSEELLLGGMTGFDLTFFIVSGIPKMFFAAFFAVAASSLARKTSMGAAGGLLIAGATLLFFAITNLLSPDPQALSLLQNPLNMEYSDTFGSYQVRSGLMMGEFSLGAAVWMVKTFLQLVAFSVGIIVLNTFFRSDKSKDTHVEEYSVTTGKSNSATTIFFFSIAVIIALLPPILSLVYDDTTDVGAVTTLGGMTPSIGNSLIIVTATTALFLLFTGLCVFAAVNLSITQAAMACGVMALLGGNIMGQYLLSRSLGMINTLFIVPIAEFIKPEIILCISVLAIIASKQHQSNGGLLRAMKPYLVLYTGMFAAIMWGSFLSEMYYSSDPSMFSVALLAQNYSLGVQGFAGVTIILLLALPPLVFGKISIFLFDRFSGKENVDSTSDFGR